MAAGRGARSPGAGTRESQMAPALRRHGRGDAPPRIAPIPSIHGNQLTKQKWSRGDSNPRAPEPKDGNDKDLGAAESGGAAKCAANRDQRPPSDPDLALIIEAWPALPQPVKAGILAMVKASAGEGDEPR